MKKLFVLAAVTGLVLALQVPASAQTGVKASLSGVSGGQAVSGSVGLRGCASSGTGVKKIEILIDGRVVKSQEFGNLQNDACIDYGWDTTRSGGGISSNGGVSIAVRAVATGGDDQTGASVTVDNAPSSPGGLSVNNSGGSVNINWSANPEPDITGYRVERDSGGGWSTVGETGGTSLSDSVGYGDHSYRVIAFRKSSISGTKSSAPTGAAGISYPAPASTDGGSTDGGTVGGDGTGTGSTGGSGSGTSGGNGGSGKGSGGGVPGYGSAGGSGKGKNGAPGSTGGGKGGLPSGYGASGTRQLSGIGLPGGLTLPGRGSASIPGGGSAAAALSEDGTFEELLPYELPDGEGTLVNDPGNPFRPAFVNEMMIIPPDALRWVGAGLWLIVTALLLKFLERRVAEREIAEVTSMPMAEETAA